MPAAQQRKAEGADVVAVYIETHKRPEIEELLAGSLWKNAVVARANALDSRHTKRYQDVEELLKVGIDVYRRKSEKACTKNWPWMSSG